MGLVVDIALLIAVVVALGEVAKGLGIPKKFIPLLSIALGVLGGVIFLQEYVLSEKILFGIIIGLSASGLFDQSKLLKKG